MPDPGARSTVSPWGTSAGTRRTAVLVVLSLVLGLLGVTGLTPLAPVPPATAAVSVTQVSNWKLDAGSGTTAADSVGTKPATLNSGATWTPGLRGASSLAMNGSNGAATTSGPVLNTTSSFSVSAYVKLNNLTGGQVLVSQDGSSGSGFYLQLRSDTHKFGFTRLSVDGLTGGTTGQANVFASADDAPVVGQWYHVAGVYDSVADTLALYVNGRLQQTVAAPSAWSATGSFAIGRGKYSGSSTFFLNGTIDEVRAYSGALTADDVEQVADSAWYKLDEGSGTVATDAGLTAVNGTLTNGPTYGPGPSGSSVTFDGTNDYIDANRSAFDTSKSFSVSAWARTAQLTSSRVVASQDSTNYSSFLLATTTNGRWAFSRASSDVASPTQTTVTSTAAVTANTWYHLVAVYDSVAGTLALYVDGVQQGAAVAYTAGWRGTGENMVGRGFTSGPAAYFNGAIDEVHMYPFAVDDAMAAQLATPTPPPTPATPTATSTAPSSATVTWATPRPISGSPTTGYVITPYLNGVAQAPQSVTSSPSTLTGLTNGASYRFTVASVNANGTSAPSAQSAAVVPTATAPAAPTGVSATAGSVSASVTWTAPTNTGGSAVTGYVVTPYVGTTAQTAQTFNSTATTQTLTGLTAGTAYTFRVAAVNAVGTGAQSAASAAVTPNSNPAIVATNPPSGQVGAAYSFTFTRTGGTSPVTWSTSAGSLPDGLSLAAGTGVLSGTPTTPGSSSFTVKLTDASAATDTRAVTLQVIGVPATPAAPSATAGPTSAVVSWVAPAANGSAITSYVVTPSRDGVVQPTQTFDASTTTRTLTGLTAQASYTFTVTAVNAVGSSKESARSSATSPYDVPAAPVITSAAAADLGATLSWNAPSANGSAITGYVVTPYIGATAQTATTYASTATTQKITGLTAGTAYTFTVAAQNAAGTGPQSAASSAVTPNANPTLTFAAPPAGVVGTAYTTQLTVNGGTSPFAWSVATGTLPPGITLSSGGLLSGTPTTVGSSTFTVQVTDASGSSATRSVTLVVSAGAPAAPAAPTAVAGVSSATVSWTAPVGNGSAITGYTVTPYLSGTAQTPVSFDASATSRTLTGLAAGSSYTFTVTAVNASGTGPASPQSNAVIPSDVPAAPSITAATAGDTRVTLSWTTPTNNGSPITGYVVTPYIGATAQTATSFSGTATTQTMTGLSPQTAYTFKVAAQNAVGTGAQSAASASVTPNANPTLTFAAPPAGSVGVAYSTQLAVTGGTAPFTWSVTAGTLPAGITLSSAGLLSGTPTTVGTSTSTVQVVDANAQTATRSVTLVVTDKPGASAAPTATAGVTSATVSWTAPSSNGSAITSYVVTPYLSGVAQTAVSFDASTTTRTVTGLGAGGSYTFTVTAVNANGSGAASPASAAVIPYDVPAAPSITAATAGTSRVTLSWTTPVTNGSPITGYVVTPYIGTAAQTATTFAGTATTQTITGLTTGTAYTFRVAARNAAGTGPQSAASTAVTPNDSPALTFPAPPAGEVGVAYSVQLTVSGGTAPFTWSVTNGSLPAGLTLSSSGLLAGTPTAAGSFAFTVQVLDGSGEVASRTVTLVVAAAPTLTFAPAAGEVAVAYSQQPTVTGGTAPYAWRISAGSLPAGVTLDASTGLVSGTPTASGTFSVTVTVTDAFAVSASRTASIVIAALPTLTFTAPPGGQVAVAYSTTFTAAGGTAPLLWSISAGSLPSGLTLNTTTGVLSGTPTTVGSSSFTVTVTDANNKAASKAVTLVVATGPLVIAKTANVSSTVAGSVVAFTITLTNTGPSAFTGVALSDPLGSPGSVLDDASYNGNAAATSGTVGYAAEAVSWSGDVGVNGSVTITYSVTVNNPSTGNRVLASTVVSSTSGTNCPSGSTDTRCTATVTVAGLSIVKSADVATTTPGGAVRFTIVVKNTGGAAVTGASLTDQLTGVLDDATYNADGAASAGQLSFASPQLTWTGNLAVGATATITYSVTVTNPDTGNRSLAATVVSPTAGSSCPSGAPAASCTTTVQVLLPGLAITNAAGSSTTTPGATVTFTQTLTNNGQTAYAGVSVSLSLGGVLDDATYTSASASSGSVVYNAGAGTLAWTGDLALGATVTVTETFTVLNPPSGDRTIAATATSGAAGSTCPVGTSNAACTATVSVLVPALTIAQTTDVSSTTPGSVVRYTVSLTNSGQTPYSGATFSESLGGVLDDATYGADAVASSGTVSYSVPTLSWTGNLAVGATATVSYSVRVRNPDPGDFSLASTVVSSTPFSTCAAGSPDARCTSTIAVLVPGLSISTTVDQASTTPGGVVRYLVSVANTGQTTYAGALVTLDFAGLYDDATYDNDAVTSSGTLVARADGTLGWVLTLAPGQNATGTASFTVLDPTPSGADRTLVSTASSDVAGSSCPAGSTATACRTSIPVLTPALTITKTASTSSVVTGGTVSYTVLVANTGETTYPAASFDDDLARVLTDATYSGDAMATTGALGYSGSVLSWSGSLAPGATATVSYSVVVRDPDPGDKRLTNTVVSTSVRTNCAAGSTDPRCTAVVDVLVPRLTIAKVADSSTTVPGGTIAFTVTITNSGAVSYPNATFSDDLTGTLDDAVYGGNETASSGSVSRVGSALVWTGDLAVGAKATVRYSVTVQAADVGDDLVTGTVTSTTKGSSCPVGSTDPRCSVTVPVARLVLTQTYDEDTTTPGSIVHARGTFANTGQVPYTGIRVQIYGDATDDGVSNGDQTVSSGTLVINPPQVYWTGDIPVGATVTGAGTITINDPDTGDRVISARLGSDAPGNNCAEGSTDTRCGDSLRVLVPGLTITKTADTATVEPGAAVGYTVTVTNTGETDYSAATGTAAVLTDDLSGVLDHATYDANATATTGTLDVSGSTLTWTGDLAVGASATVITFSVTTLDPATGDKALLNVVSSTNVGSTCPVGTSSAACRTSTTILTPALTVTKTADVSNATLGATVTYTLSATNSGQTNYPAATLSDSLAGVLDDARYNPASTTGDPVYDAGTLSWTGPLAIGQTKIITYTVTVNNPSTGRLLLDNTVVSTTQGSNCAPGSGDPRCRATVVVTDAVALTLTKTANVVSTVDGAKVLFTVTATNSSTAALNAVNFSDPLAGVLDDASYDGDAAVSAGAVSYSGTTLTWTGTVPAGGTVTLTYSVTVGSPASGDLLLTSKISSTSPSESNNCLVGSTDPRCTVTVAVARLVLTQRALETSATPGSLIHLPATYTNTGRVPYTGISVTQPRGDTVDDIEPIGDDTASSGDLVRTPEAVVWRGDIAVGQTVTLDVVRRVKNPPTGNRVVTSTLVSDAPGNNCIAGTTDLRCTFRVAVVVPQLTIRTTASTSYVVPGGTVQHTLTIRNSGETPYVGAVVDDNLTGVLDDAAFDANAVATSGTVSFTSPVLTWTGDLAVGATATVSFSVTALSPPPGDKIAVNQVSSTTVGSTCPPASGSASCRSTVLVLTPALTISSRASQTTAVPGDTVTFTVTASNTGQTAYTPASLTLPLDGLLDDASYTGDVAATAGTAAVSGQTLSWSGNLAPGSATTITYSVLVRPPAGGDFRLAQTVSSGNVGSTCPASSGCTTSVAVAGLRIATSTDASSTAPTKVVRYTGTFTNTGQVPYVGISVSDSFVGALDNATYNGDAAATSGSLAIVAGSGRVVWTGDVAVGQTVTITASVTVSNPATGDDRLTTLITTEASGSNCPPGGTDNDCATSVTLLRPQLSVTTTVSSATTTPGGSVGYTITATNTGQTAYAGAVVRDDLTSALTNAALGDLQASRGTVSTSNQVLSWVGDLAVGEQVVITFTLRTNDPDLGGGFIGNTVTSDEVGSSCPTGGADPACSTLVTILRPALDISVTADQTSTTPGSRVGYTIVVSNSGETDSTGATVTAALSDVLDDAAYADDATVSGGGVLTYGESALTWTGDLAIGETATISYHVTVADPDTGNRSLVTSLSSAAAGSTCSEADPCVNTVAVLLPGLDVSTSASVATATPGQPVTFTLRIRNTGQTAYTETSVSSDLAGVVDDATFDGAIRSTSGATSYVGTLLTWTGTLAVGDETLVTYRVVVKPSAALTPEKVLRASVLAEAAGSTCRTGSADARCAAAVQVLVPALTITKSADATTTTPGGQLRYTISIRNTGETSYAGATVSDSLAGLLGEVTYAADATVTGGGVLTYRESTLTWTGDLLPGATATVTYSLRVNDPYVGDRALSNTVVSSAAGSSCPTGNAQAGCTAVVQVLMPALGVTQTVDKTSVVAGDRVTYTVRLTNTGETDYLPATFRDPLAAPGVGAFADYANDALASVGTVAYTDETLVWTGPLLKGATATVTFSVVTRYPAPAPVDGVRLMRNTVTSSNAGSTCVTGSRARCRTAVTVLQPALSITKTADTTQVVAGGTLRYAISATNTGEAAYPMATLSDDLGALLPYGVYAEDATATAGVVSRSGDTLSWSGPLAQGDTVLISFTVRVAVDTPDTVVLANRVVSSSTGSTCSAGSGDPGCVTSTAIAARSVTLTDLAPSFTLKGLPSATVEQDGAVSLTVTTNSSSGYAVTVASKTDGLTGSSGTIPIDRLSVRGSAPNPFVRMSTTPVTVHTSTGPSSPDGDAISNDYRVEIPADAASGTYTTELEYIATAQ